MYYISHNCITIILYFLHTYIYIRNKKNKTEEEIYLPSNRLGTVRHNEHDLRKDSNRRLFKALDTCDRH